MMRAPPLFSWRAARWATSGLQRFAPTTATRCQGSSKHSVEFTTTPGRGSLSHPGTSSCPYSPRIREGRVSETRVRLMPATRRRRSQKVRPRRPRRRYNRNIELLLGIVVIVIVIVLLVRLLG